MDFRILGPLEVWDRGRPLELHSRKQRALLAMLALRAGEAVSSDGLIDGLWGEEAPRTARASVQNHVSQLRRALGPGVLLSRAGGYLLDITPEQVDLGRFERLAAEARTAEGEERVERLREALALWRGPPLDDLAYEPFAAYESARLDELRTAALEDRLDAELALGGGAELVGELEALIAEHPFRERLRGQLMLALYRSGRQADALDAYQETRRTLVDELGIEPSAPLRELEQAILRQDASLVPAASVDGEVAAPPEERRRTVTVLVADIACPETLDPELLHRTSVAALTSVREVLERHGATIEQRAGDEVMAVFGVPRAHEDDTLRAARAALELGVETRPRADLLEAEEQERIELRVGIETGEVLAGADEAGHGFIAGPAIGLAKRLVQRALPGEILAGPATLRLLGGAVRAEPAAGRGGASCILEVVEGVPALERDLEAPLVGRAAELAALHQAFKHAVGDRRSNLHLILGEAGIGKTRLASEFTAKLEGNATVFVGRCVPYGKGATYLPLAEIIRRLRARRELRELLAGDEHAELIAARLAQVTGEEHGSASGGETFWAVRRLLEALAGERPVVLVLEDLHWAEPTLLDLIEYLSERAATAPILLLGLARPELLEERPGWAETETTRLAPLSNKEGAVLVENLADVPDDLRAQIVRTSGGNPLFLEQLLVHATEHGEPEKLPPSLDALLASRLDRLEPEELAVLQRAAVVGREFSRDSVVDLLGEGGASVDARLLALERKDLIRERRRKQVGDEAFVFHHALIREAAYATLPKKLRTELHERFARWLESNTTGSDELIGFHLEQAYRYCAELGSVDGEARRLAADAGDRLAAAGVRAAKSGDTHAASNLLTRASALLQAEEVVRRDLLTELGLVLWRSGEIADAGQVFDTAIKRAILERDRRAELRGRIELAHLRLNRAEGGAPEELLSLADEAIPVLEQLEDDRALGRIWFALATTYGSFHCQYGKASDAAERALAYFRRSDWPLVPCLQELAAGFYYGPTPVPEAIRRCRALLEEADRGGEAQILVYLAGLEAMAERFDSARDLAAHAREIYEDLAWTVNVSANYAPGAANVELLAGDFAAAERLLTESCGKLETWGLRGQLATQAAQLAEAVYGQRRYDEALRWSETAETFAASYDTGAQFLWRAVRGKALVRQGAVGKGERLAREAVDLAAATDSVNQRADVLLSYGEVLRLEGRTAEAVEAIKQAIRLFEKKSNRAATRQARDLLVEVAGV